MYSLGIVSLTKHCAFWPAGVVVKPKHHNLSREKTNVVRAKVYEQPNQNQLSGDFMAPTSMCFGGDQLGGSSTSEILASYLRPVHVNVLLTPKRIHCNWSEQLGCRGDLHPGSAKAMAQT
jgi:hypothetical protein